MKVGYSFGNAEPALVCIKCQAPEQVSDRVVAFSKIAPVAYLSFLLGPLVALIVLALTSKNHTLGLPLCRVCWTRYRFASWASGFSIILFCGSLAAGLAMMLQFETGYLFWPAPIVATAVMAYLFYSKQSALPRVLHIDKAQVVLDGGVHGKITFRYHGIATRS